MKVSRAILIISIAGTTRAFSLGEWLNNPPYANGGTIQEQINCYALPYGAIGFSSHLLTYLTVLALSLGRDPLMPWRPLRHKWFDIGLAVLGFCVSFTMTVLTMVRCRNTWPFILLAVWKQVFSTTLTVMVVDAARKVITTTSADEETRLLYEQHQMEHRVPQNPQYRSAHRNSRASDQSDWEPYPYAPPLYENEEDQPQHPNRPNDDERFQKIWWWAIPYSLGAIVGAVGILALVKGNISANQQLQIITGVFGGVASLLILANMAVYWTVTRRLDKSQPQYGGQLRRFTERVTGSFLALTGASLFAGTLLFAFYSDWALAAMAGDIVGQPTRDNAVYYWLYFAAKRLPMLSV
ncbi:hypothetical protein B0T16DRAFT_411802 [Cercophora newfieldiana]|uniref:Uncharacterized protein n=1 Tax=Cercophora newfieldiana TaxID=92897 RepID=A0AA40CQB4_9PEZI|nr:hypothetical protein B0T16DRAFT_411802 [Cercophora newfieldiana]